MAVIKISTPALNIPPKIKVNGKVYPTYK